MSYDDEIQRLTEIERITNGRPSHLDMDEAFSARMRMAIEAGLESAPIGVITTPGTRKPKYLSFPKIISARIGAHEKNQRMIRHDGCDP